MGHGSKSLLTPTRSELHQGFFGRMFRNIPPHIPSGGRGELRSIAETMFEPTGTPQPGSDNPAIPAGYTYFGQFVDHDITFDPRSSLERMNDPDMLENFRTPKFDLDSIYGRGPEDQPYLYEDGVRIKIGKNAVGEDDLQRNVPDGRAVIGDHRNDENLIVAQMQLAFIKFHNQVADDLASDHGCKAKKLFEEAQRIVRWHYQYVVIHDYVRRLCGGQVLTSKLPDTSDAISVSRDARLRFYDISNRIFMPIEFSVAAFRLGHTMVRNAYQLNDHLPETPIFSVPGQDLSGFRPLPEGHTVQWDKFLVFDNTPGAGLQLSRKLDEKLSRALRELHIVDSVQRPSLAELNLLRGFSMGLPSGQDVARAMGIIPRRERMADPLWFYILEEAGGQQNGERLGRVGAHIVAEVFVGLLAGDACSYLNVDPRWTPQRELSITIPQAGPTLQLSDIVKYAGMPITINDIPSVL